MAVKGERKLGGLPPLAFCVWFFKSLIKRAGSSCHDIFVFDN